MVRAAAVAVAAALLTGCATTGSVNLGAVGSVEVLSVVDRVPVTQSDALLPAGAGARLEEGRRATCLTLGGDLADDLRAGGATVCEGEVEATSLRRPDARTLAARGRLDVVVATELVAYGQVRRSWLRLLAGQGLLAGVGHGVVVAKATGRSALGWWVGAGEFLLETVTWVGGASLASPIVDPVIVRVWAVRTSDGEVLGTWTREGTSPVREWVHRSGRAPRCDRLRAVADKLFHRISPRLLARLAAHAGLPARSAEPQ